MGPANSLRASAYYSENERYDLITNEKLLKKNVD